MRILGLSTSYPKSNDDDSSVFVHRLYQALAAAGHSVTVLAPAQGEIAETETRDGVRVVWFTFTPWGRSRLMYGAGIMQNIVRAPWLAVEIPFFFFKLSRLAATEGRAADIVHGNWIPTGVAAAIASIFSKAPFVVTLRGSDARLLKSWAARWLSYIGVFPAARITAVSTSLLQELFHYYPGLRTKSTAIYNGVELSCGSTDAQLPPLPERFLVAIGSVIPRKNIEALLEMLKEQELKDYSLIICGKTEDRTYLAQLLSIIERNGLDSRVKFLGAIPPHAIPALLSKSSAFISASAYEGRPNALLEALFCEKSVFASNIAAHREIITDGVNGYLFDATQHADAAKRIASALRDTEQCRVISKEGKHSVEGHSWKSCAEHYSELFTEVISTNLRR